MIFHNNNFEKTTNTMASTMQAFRILDLPLKLRESIYAQLHLPSAVIIAFDAKRKNIGQKYEFEEDDDIWATNDEDHPRTICTKIKAMLCDVQDDDLISRSPHTIDTSGDLQHSIDWANEVEETYGGDSLLVKDPERVQKLQDLTTGAKSGIQRVQTMRFAMQATIRLLASNRQLAGELRTVIRRTVVHQCYLNRTARQTTTLHYNDDLLASLQRVEFYVSHHDSNIPRTIPALHLIKRFVAKMSALRRMDVFVAQGAQSGYRIKSGDAVFSAVWTENLKVQLRSLENFKFSYEGKTPGDRKYKLIKAVAMIRKDPSRQPEFVEEEDYHQ